MEETYFDIVPYDVLQKVLAPFLDTESVVNFNRIVQQRDRISRRFPKDYAVKHCIRINTVKWNDMMSKFELEIDQKKRSLFLNQIFRDILHPMNSQILWHNEGFRKSIMNIMLEFKNPSSLVYGQSVSKRWKKSFVILATKGLKHIEANPFRYAIKTD
jgi:hypothetical protein